MYLHRRCYLHPEFHNQDLPSRRKIVLILSKHINLHCALQCVKLSIFALLHQLQVADELGDCGIQASQQLSQAALLLILGLGFHCFDSLFRGDGSNAGEGTRAAEQTVALRFRKVCQIMESQQVQH